MEKERLVKMLQDPFMLELVNSLLAKYGATEIYNKLGQGIDSYVFQEGEIDNRGVMQYLEVTQARMDKVGSFLQAYSDLESECLLIIKEV